MKKYLTVYLGAALFLVCLWAALPLFGRNYIPTHDGEYHIIRIVEFSKMLASGYLFPRWAPTLNSGYGIPIFQFHYPLPNYIGSFMRLFTHDAVYAFQISMGVGYLLAALGSFLWLTSLYGALAGLFGAIVGAYVPYLFVDIYVRGSIGEVWAIVILFFVLWTIEKKQYMAVALLYGLLLLSHNILGMICTPFLFIYMAIRNKKAIGSLVWGMGLSAYFWLPAFLEARYVVGLNTVNFREHFVALYELLIPSWGTEFSGSGFSANKISFQIGIVPIVIIIASFVVFIREREKQTNRLVKWFLLLIGLVVFFMSPWSKWIWEVARPFQFIQYPWRLLSFMIPTTAFLTAYVAKRSKLRFVVVLAVLAVLCTFPYSRKVQYAPRNEAYYLARNNFTDGTSSMGNSFSTIWTGWKEKRPEAELVAQNGRITKKGTWSYLKKEFTVNMTSEGLVTFNTLYFPGWVVEIDGQKVPILYEYDGIIRTIVPIGIHTVSIRFTDTLPRIIGNGVSIVSLVGIIGWGILSLYAHRNRHIQA
jgi:hypothetical protein